MAHMSRIFAIVGALLLLPYAYAVYYWGFCADCRMTSQSLVYSLGLFFALPFVIAAFAIYSSFSTARALRDNLVERAPVRSMFSGFWLAIAILVAVPFVAKSWKMYQLWFPEVEEDRDLLNRICERDGNSTVCRPDPQTKPDALDDVNRIPRERGGLQS